jgi:PAS domain S-box-containing protein
MHAGEDLLRLLFESSLDAVLLVTVDGDVLAANPAAEAMFGHSEAELRTLGWPHLLDTSEPRFKVALNRHQSEGRFSGELSFFDSTGRKFPGELSSSGLVGTDGERLTSIIIRDISERKRTEQALSRSLEAFRRLAQISPAAIFRADVNGDCTYANRRCEEGTGRPLEELLGDGWLCVMHPEDRERVLAQWRQDMSAHQPKPLEWRVLRPDGTVRWVLSEAAAELDEHGKPIGYISCLSDITELKDREERRRTEVAEHRDTLVREVHHRIKNNLQSVAGLLQRELGRFVDLDPRLETAITQVHAIAVVHGLQSANPDEAVHLCDSVSNICRTVSNLSQRPVLFHIEHEHTAFTPVRIESSESVPVALMLNELILNAVKHSPESGHAPTVALQADGTAARITIRNPPNAIPEFNIDTGLGLGTGLRLVRSLLPANGAQLSYGFDDEGLVVTKLSLSAPVVGRILPKASQ